MRLLVLCAPCSDDITEVAALVLDLSIIAHGLEENMGQERRAEWLVKIEEEETPEQGKRKRAEVLVQYCEFSELACSCATVRQCYSCSWRRAKRNQKERQCNQVPAA